MQAVLFVLRKTNGYNKREDIISLSQFSLGTGLKKPNCIRGIDKALRMGLIIRTDNGNHYTYRINKDFNSWKPLSTEITLSARIKKIIHTK